MSDTTKNKESESYYVYSVKLNGVEKWVFGTTENLRVSDFKITKKKVIKI